MPKSTIKAIRYNKNNRPTIVIDKASPLKRDMEGMDIGLFITLVPKVL